MTSDSLMTEYNENSNKLNVITTFIFEDITSTGRRDNQTKAKSSDR